MSLVAEPATTHRRLAGSPEIVVIVPIYGHPVLLSEAIESVLAQQCAVPIGIVIVSDGCRMAETDLVASAYAFAHAHIVYLRKTNGGPSSARNYGIDYALRNWPSMEAVYFLDADNRLTPTALADAYDVLAGQAGIGWVYPNIDSFGISWSANYGVPYSPLLHIVYDNICDTGSLVAKAVLEAGVRFDEDAKSGYEDWDFWLQCLDHGFVGRHAQFGFTYRQRPESRYREMNRQRGAMVEHLRRRHWAIARPKNLLRWEHESNPRYLHTPSADAPSFAFTDPVERGPALAQAQLVEQFYAALQHPDEALLWPFLLFGAQEALDALTRLKVLHGVLALMEREAGRTSFVAVTLTEAAGEIAVDIGPPKDRGTLASRAMLWMCRGRQIREIVQDEGESWARSLATSWPEPAITEIRVCGPLDGGSRWPVAMAATDAMMDLIGRLRDSPMRGGVLPRWNWRSKHFPAREDYYRHVCKYLGVSALMPRLASSRIEVGIVVPIASFGGAEKVAYAMARYLRRRGARLHLFVLGKPVMKVLSEYEDAFDTINFLADPDFPVWGGPVTILGQECFLPDSPEVKAPDVAGLLVNLDLVVNAHSAPLNSIMGTLRAQQKAKTATYLHVFDATPLRRPVGHPYLTVAFEHAYDLVLTCSRQLGEQVHALGVPLAKIMPIPNAAGFTIDADTRADQIAWRATPRGSRKLRALYLGRLDRQKGVERLLGAVERLAADNAPVEVRVVGAGLMETGGDGWGEALRALGVSIEPPVYATERLIACFAWADVLVLPSRWEGAPLVIPECHQLGCIPIATRVGAVEELMTDGVDGLFVESGTDAATAAALAAAIRSLVTDDGKRRALAEAGMARSRTNTWEANFAPLGAWVEDFVAERGR